MARRSEKATGTLNLDSLVDIVSNIVGILVLLAAFMALFGMLSQSSQLPSQAIQLQPEKVMVPWSHSTNKPPVLFILQGNRLMHLDLREFYRNLANIPPGDKPKQTQFKQDGVTIGFFPISNQTYCLVFEPQEKSGETWLQADRDSSSWKKAQLQYPSQSFYYFFWVRDDSFELFRDVRKSLWDANYEVGWKPIGPKSPLEICNGFEGSRGFQPQ